MTRIVATIEKWAPAQPDSACRAADPPRRYMSNTISEAACPRRAYLAPEMSSVREAGPRVSDPNR